MSSPAVASPAPILIQAGSTILIPSGPIGSHLFVVLFGAQTIGGREKFLLVPFDSQHSKCDKACLLTVGEHEFIVNPTFVGYRHCRIDDHGHLIKCIQDGTFTMPYSPVSNVLLAKIEASYRSTKTVPRYIRNDWGY